MWWTLLACTFVEPPVEPIELEPPQPVLDQVDARRVALQATDAGAELWRSIDAHGGLLRYERVGPWTAHLADGTTVGPGHADHELLTRPFSMVDETPDPVPKEGSRGVEIYWVGGHLHLDPTSRQVRSWADGRNLWHVRSTRPVQGVHLITHLEGPFRTLTVTRWEPANPLPGWPLDAP